MNEYTETLEDLLCYMECARDNLLLVHCAIESGTIPEHIMQNALFGVHVYLDMIAKEMGRQIAALPCEVLQKAAVGDQA